MSRGMIRSTSDVCADCSAPDPGWASVNRGVLICEECCSIHRSLGRHISQVKSLKKGSWSPTQLAMVHQLVSTGANHVWEHTLLDPSQNKQGRRKPNPRDPVHPTKADFIRAKYQFLAFVNKQKDSEITSVEDLSKQLHSSVRTSNLETSMRLLSLGADPNYFHAEKNNCPLHVAAESGQSLQVELLVVYGADPGAFDEHGKTPIEHGRKEGHADQADRLLECQYELTDRLAYFLCSRKPDHRAGQHFIIPEMADSSLDLSELAKAAKKKLQALPNPLFEELAMDVYDEVDRRENEAIWLAAQNQTSVVSDRQTVPFLPVNPEFSSTRNQGRQKLARFNKREFATLIIDILSDAKRRQAGSNSPRSAGSDKDNHDKSDSSLRLEMNQYRLMKHGSSFSDDEPLYDSVASDEDYASIGDSQSMKEEKLQKETDAIRPDESIASSDQSEAPITLEEYMAVKRALVESQARVQLIFQTNKDLKQEITLLQNMVQRLIQENEFLRTGDGTPDGPHPMANGHDSSTDSSLRSTGRHVNRPQSMFEPRDPQRQHHWNKNHPPIKEEEAKAKELTEEDVSNSTIKAQAKLAHQGANSAESDYDNANVTGEERNEQRSSRSSGRSDSSQLTPTNASSTPPLLEGAAAASAPDSGSGEDLVMPAQEDVVKKTEKITKKIQELLISAQDGKHDKVNSACSYSTCSDKIHSAVGDMIALFPQNIQDEQVQASLRLLRSGAERLQSQCSHTPPAEVNGQVDQQLHTQQVIQCAYDIAKAAKQLVILFE